VIAAPTNYDPAKNFFDTHHIEDVIDLVLSVNPEAVMVIKSTIPVGYTRSLYVKYAQKFQEMGPLPDGRRRELRLLFSPEFLRESKALEDNLWPSRIIVGYPKMMSEDEVRQAVYHIIASVDIFQTGKGAIMKAVMPRLKGKADGKLINKVVTEICEKTGE
jgi:UDP-glucose 6-dehydrogenase